MIISKITEPIRVLHVVTIMNRGGLETMLMNYYRHIDRTKVQFDFLVHRTQKGAYDDEIIKLGGRLFYAPPITLKNVFSYGRKLDAFFREHPEYMIVHSHLDALSALPLAAAKRAGVKLRIAHAHNNGFNLDFKRIVRIVAKRFIHSYSNRYFGCSHSAAIYMFGKNVKHKVLYNAIDLSAFKFNLQKRNGIRSSLHLEDSFVVGHVGRFNPQKNHTFLIDVFNELCKIKPEAMLMLVGTGELQDEVEQKVQSLGITNKILFLGSRDDVSDLMQAMDVFVLPSRYEGLGIVAIEAQATGLACFYSDRVIPKEVEISNNAYPIGLEKNSEEWASIILKKSDKLLSKRASKYNKHYDINIQATALQAYYTSLSQGNLEKV